MFQANPQYAYAIFQSLLMMGLIDPASIQSILKTGVVAAPPPVVQQPQPSNTPDLQAEQQKALIMQIMNLTKEQIDSLPAEQRQQILILKSQLGH